MKTSLKYYLATMIVCVFIFSSCKKKEDDDTTPPPATPEVFVPEVTPVGTDSGIASSLSIGTEVAVQLFLRMDDWK